MVCAFFSRLTESWGLGFSEAWDLFKTRSLDESDKKSWEATRKYALSLTCVLYYLVKIKDISLWGAAGAAYLVHHLYPIIGWSGDQCIRLKPGQLTSGTLLTARSNTDYHKALIKCFFQFVSSHDSVIGARGCCAKCDVLGKEYHFTPEDAREILSAIVMGDDFISLHNVLSEAFANFCDNYCGTVTIGDERAWDEAEFLKRKLTEIEGYPSSRRTKHVIGKLKGPHSITASSKIASVISAAVDCNDIEVYNDMRAIYTVLTSGMGPTVEVDHHLKNSYKGLSAITDFPSFECIQANHVPRPLDVVKMERNRKKLYTAFDL